MTSSAPVLIVSYNSTDVLPECLASLVENGGRILVYDNCSSDGTVNFLADTFPTVDVVAGAANIGFGGAVNRLVDLSGDTEYFLLLNPDCRVDKAVLDSLKLVLDEAPGIAAVAPRMVYPDGRPGIVGGPRPSLFKELAAATRLDELVPRKWLRGIAARTRDGSALARLLSYWTTHQPRGLVDLEWVSAYCLLVRREAFKAVGGFDERFFLYFEDVDLCLRLREAGWSTVCQSDLAAIHFESSSTRRAGKGRLYRAGMRAFFLTHGSLLERTVARIGANL